MPLATRSDVDHLPGCPAAISMAGWHEDCRCTELARIFDVPTRAECFAEPDVAAAHARWREARARAQARLAESMRAIEHEQREGLELLDELSARQSPGKDEILHARALLSSVSVRHRVSGRPAP